MEHHLSLVLTIKKYLVKGGGGGGGVQGRKSWKHDFKITGDPKDQPSGSTFWSCFEPRDCKATSFLRALKWKMANEAKNHLLRPIDR